MVSLKQILSIHGSACLARRLQEPSRAFLICINRTDFNNTCRVNQLGWHLWCPIRFQRGPVIPPLWLRPRHLGWTSWSGGPALCSAWSWTLWGQRGEHPTDCWLFWTMSAILCTLSSATRGARSATACPSPSATPTDWKTKLSLNGPPRAIKLLNTSHGGRQRQRRTEVREEHQACPTTHYIT